MYFFFRMYLRTLVTFVYVCIYACIDRFVCICARALFYLINPIDLCTVITCECWQHPKYGRTALLWASERGHAETVRVLVELGASVEAVDKVHIHAHALAYTCCIKQVPGIMRMIMIIMSHACACICICMYIHSYVDMYIHVYVCMYVCIYE